MEAKTQWVEVEALAEVLVAAPVAHPHNHPTALKCVIAWGTAMRDNNQRRIGKR